MGGSHTLRNQYSVIMVGDGLPVGAPTPTRNSHSSHQTLPLHASQSFRARLAQHGDTGRCCGQRGSGRVGDSPHLDRTIQANRTGLPRARKILDRKCGYSNTFDPKSFEMRFDVGDRRGESYDEPAPRFRDRHGHPTRAGPCPGRKDLVFATHGSSSWEARDMREPSLIVRHEGPIPEKGSAFVCSVHEVGSRLVGPVWRFRLVADLNHEQTAGDEVAGVRASL
jgi:hypothetical protein